MAGTTLVTRPTATPMIVTSEPSKMLMACGKCAVTVRSLALSGNTQATTRATLSRLGQRSTSSPTAARQSVPARSVWSLTGSESPGPFTCLTRVGL